MGLLLKPPVKIQSICALLLTSTLWGNTAIAEKVHVHGVANMFIAIEGNKVSVEMESPAGNILGFEHAPSTSEQQQILEESLARLSQHSAVVTFTEANCQQVKQSIESPFAVQAHHSKEHDHDEHKHDHDKHKHDHDEHKHDHGEHKGSHNDTHSDFHLSYTLNCPNAEAMAGANITAFQSFNGFEKIRVHWLNAIKQGSQQTSEKQSTVRFE